MENEIHTIKVADLIIKAELGEVQVNNKTVRLGPVNMKVLLKLVEQPNVVVTRGELFDSIWKNQIISDDALTKSISEIRAKLGQYSNYKKLILTIPKKGYQWNPSELTTNIIEKIEPKLQQTTLKSLTKNLLLVLISLMILTIGFLWIANKYVEVKHIPILLLPIEIYEKNLKNQRDNLEDLLRKNMLTTKNMRFLSKSVLNKEVQFSLFNQSIAINTQWAIEARIRKIRNKLRYTLSLIDTRTGLEIYSKSLETDKKQEQLDNFSLNFIKSLEQRIRF